MNKFMEFMDKHFIPVATKIGSQRHLVAIRDAFISIMPITMVGSIAVLLNVFLRDLPNSNGMQNISSFFAPVIAINGNVWFASIAILTCVFVFALGYHLSVDYKVNAIAGGLVSFASFVAFLPQTATFEATIGTTTGMVSSWGLINVNYLGATGLFTGLIVGMISSMIYIKLMINKVIIKMPDSVPPAVSKAFASIIPGVAAVYVAAISSYLIFTITGLPLNDLVAKYIQLPLLGLSQGLFSVVLLSFLVQLFWFFGIHGHNVLAPVMDGIYMPALLENVNHFSLHGIQGLPYIWTRGSFDAYAQMGGSGVTISLIIAILLFSKRDDSKAVAKLSLPMGIFNINEPVTFGMPIVLNPLYIIPWLIIPPICVIVAYSFTAAGMIPPVFVAVPWVMPPGIYAFLATGGNLPAALVSLLNVFIAFVIWTPFVLIANKMEDVQ